MASGDNLSDSESLHWIAAGFIVMILGLLIFMFTPFGIVFALMGLISFFIGYYRHNPFHK